MTDPRGALQELARRYRALDDTTDERLVRDLATARRIPENLIRMSVGLTPIRDTHDTWTEAGVSALDGGEHR